MKNKMHVKKGDTVAIISGKEKGKKGKIVAVSNKEKKIIIEGCNIATKHIKSRRQGEHGTIAKVETPIYACKVMLVCPVCGKTTRISHKISEDGKKYRVCKRKECGKTF